MADEIYHRLNNCEKEIHTLKHRIDVLEEERLSHRVTNLESISAQVQKDVAKIESRIDEMVSCVQELHEGVTSMRAHVKGFVLILGALLTILQILPYLKGVAP